MEVIVPFSSAAHVAVNADNSNYIAALVATPWLLVDVATLGKGGVAKRVVRTSGWVKRSVFNSLDPAIQKKVTDAIKKGVVAPTGRQGIIKLTTTEAAQTGYQSNYRIKPATREKHHLHSFHFGTSIFHFSA